MSQLTATSPLLSSRISGGRRFRNRLAMVLIWLSVLVAAIPLAFVVVYLVQKGASVVSWDFLRYDIPISARMPGGGMGPAVLGTVLITGAATLMAVPLGVLAAVYLNEFRGRGRLAALIRFLADVMAGVPSIVMGLFVYTIWVLQFGQSGFAGALALACLMLPIVIRSAETALLLVPAELREASTALGARTSRTVLKVVIPAALPGLVSGSLLAIARAAGETAPLLFTIGVVNTANPDLFGGTNTALSAQIFVNATQPFEAAIDRAWGAALTLVGLVFLLTALARVVARRFTAR
ncbi:MAG: phosphate ABC transporter permease PstA [Actinomycetota bacterium]|nr:phosphate ABC transporter permease PstA [Actinomycetota bacterium]